MLMIKVELEYQVVYHNKADNYQTDQNKKQMCKDIC